MKSEEFNRILEERIASIKGTLAKKADEYVQGNDRLYNFRRAGKINGTSPEAALWGMATKHLVSVVDLIEDAGIGIRHTNERIDEKIGDMINYLILLEALLKEEIC